MRAPQDEATRLHALQQLKLLDTPPSASFDRITRMAGQIFGLPIAAVSLTDHDRQWLKSRIGVEHWQIPRDKAPCSAVAEASEILVVPDLLADECYRDSVLARSGIRFYAGAPLITREGFGLGAMCVLGTEPRQASPEERTALSDLADMVMGQIELQHAFGRIEPLSGLPNRHQFLDDLQDQARDFPGALRSVVIADLIDTARLSEALRVLGPGAVDDLVRTCTRYLSAALGPEVTVYQVGPTQFARVVAHVDAAGRDRFLTRIGGRIEAYLRDTPFPPLANAVCGITPFRLGEVTADDVLRTAHSAAQDARNDGVSVRIYSEAADQSHRRLFRLLADMTSALAAQDQLSLVYQPRVDMRSGACVGVEALLRWRHPGLGQVSPGEFMPAVERSDLAKPVTDWVIGEAIRQALAWRQDGLELPISVNVSVTNLEEPDFAACLEARLEAAGLPAGALEIEVTESALIRDGSRVGDQLKQARDAGIKVSIDDFGTGYSSLSYLQTLPADTIKIDQSFIRDLASDERGRTLVRSMIGMARDLDFRVVAEGVEDAAALDFLRSADCNEAQGYLISRPLGPDALVEWLRERDATEAQAA
ncbi:MAG: diguanylate cyclase/phosphodiesterase (GGDEF & EAL domains) with PAS/PAC sensor(s), partial [uncultured Microvirga sp.]